MKGIISQTALGFLSLFSGIYLAYFTFSGMSEGITPWLLVPAIFLIAVGVYFLVRAGKLDYSVMPKKDVVKQDDAMKPEKTNASILERNNQMSKEWSKTVDEKDKLKILEMAAAAEEQAKAEQATK